MSNQLGMVDVASADLPTRFHTPPRSCLVGVPLGLESVSGLVWLRQSSHPPSASQPRPPRLPSLSPEPPHAGQLQPRVGVAFSPLPLDQLLRPSIPSTPPQPPRQSLAVLALSSFLSRLPTSCSCRAANSSLTTRVIPIHPEPGLVLICFRPSGLVSRVG